MRAGAGPDPHSTGSATGRARCPGGISLRASSLEYSFRSKSNESSHRRSFMNHHASVMLRICDACGAQHQLAARRLIVALTLATALLTPSHAFGSVDGRLSFPHAATSAFTWFEPIEMHWSGLPVSARSFVAALPLEQAARLMARHEKRFQ